VITDHELPRVQPPATKINPFIGSIATATSLDGLCGSWFLSPETFLIDHTPIPMPPNFKASDLDRFIQLLLGWLKTWVLTGSNLFIHHQLYDDRFPICLQIAFTTVLSYFGKTTETSGLILRALNARAAELVADIEAVWTDTMDIVDMLARVQSLLVYQVIGLLDGDLRSRYLAEQRSTLLVNLLGKVLDKASATLSHDLLASELHGISRTHPTSASYVEREWRAWVISESVRRTWLLGTGFNSAYDGLTTGWTSCGGDLMCTTRNGLWGAKTWYDWSKLCMEADVRFVGRFRAEWLFDVPPDEVDDFVKMLLDVTYGKDRTSMWLCR
jgi:hypothetical protein